MTGDRIGVIMLNIDTIKEQVGCNHPATEAQIKICNLKLKQNNLPEIPDEYVGLLKICNGFSNEDALVFGADVKNHNWYKDIADFNIAYFHNGKSDWLILGENDFFLFVYASQQQKYFIVDRDTLEENFSDTDFMPMVNYILRIE
jgi:hypothetical protein